MKYKVAAAVQLISYFSYSMTPLLNGNIVVSTMFIIPTFIAFNFLESVQKFINTEATE